MSVAPPASQHPYILTSHFVAFLRRRTRRANRRRIVLSGLHRRLPALRLYPLEDAGVMPGRDPAVAAALRAAPAKGDVLPAVGADDHQRVRELEFLLPFRIEAVEERGEVGEGLLEGHAGGFK